MAIILMGELVTGIRGKVGGLIYSANGSGPFVRPWARGSNPRTPDQTANRSDLARISQIWQGIDPADQADWDTYAALPAQELTNPLGEPYYISGFLWFCRLAMNRVYMGLPPSESAPVAVVFPAPTISTFSAVSGPAGAVTITYPQDEFAGKYMLIQSFLANSEGRLRHVHNFRNTYYQDAPHPTTEEFGDEVRALFGDLSATQRLFIWVRALRGSGRRSAPTAKNAEVA